MKYLYLNFCLLLMPLLGFSQTGCGQYREGKFKVTDPATKQVCYITRENGIQTEKMEESEEAYTFDIKWLDDCTYTLTPTASTLARKKDVKEIGTMTVKIIQIKDNSYVHKITVANNPKFKRVDEVFIVEEKQ